MDKSETTLTFHEIKKRIDHYDSIISSKLQWIKVMLERKGKELYEQEYPHYIEKHDCVPDKSLFYNQVVVQTAALFNQIINYPDLITEEEILFRDGNAVAINLKNIDFILAGLEPEPIKPEIGKIIIDIKFANELSAFYKAQNALPLSGNHCFLLFDRGKKTMEEIDLKALDIVILSNYANWLFCEWDTIEPCYNNDVELPNEQIDDKTDFLYKENNKFNSLTLKDVYDHFYTWTQKLNKNGEKFLSNECLIIFIKMAFCESIPIYKQTLNYNPGEIKTIRQIFYTFYELTIKKQGIRPQRDDYIHLLTDYFTGFDFTRIKNNFNRK